MFGVSLIFGFAVSGFSTSVAFGFFDLDYYFLIYIVITLISWTAFLIIRMNFKVESRVRFSRRDSLVLIPIVWAIVLSRNTWNGLMTPILHSGSAPDTSQNLMSGLVARSLGRNWWEQRDNLNQLLSTDSIRESVFNLYSIPSVREQAGFDYLVFGGRWGLNIPFSQIIRYFGDHSVLWESGVVKLVSLISVAVLTYVVGMLLAKRNLLALVISLISISNSAFLVQYFNGGLSQAWATPGLMGILLAIAMSVKNKSDAKEFSNFTILILATASWLILLVTYIDAALVLLIFVLILITLSFFKDRELAFVLVKKVVGGLLVAACTLPVLMYNQAMLLDFRFSGSTGTGYNKGLWAFPSELLGFVDVFSQSEISRDFLSAVFSGSLTIFIIWCLVRLMRSAGPYSFLGLMGMAAFFTIMLGLALSYFGKLQSNYIYSKFGVYLSAFILVPFIIYLGRLKQNRPATKNSDTKLELLVPVLLVSVALFSSNNAVANAMNQGTTISSNFKELFSDSEAQREFSEYNYLASYVETSTNLGVLGDIHWISKPTNSIDLRSRRNNELRLICFESDLYCKPTAKLIKDSKLIQYGFKVFESPVTVEAFEKMTTIERYNINFIAFGLEPIKIPKRLLGGNPYFNEP
jgi:hypothetical protein